MVIEINYSQRRPRHTNPTNEGNEPEDEHYSLRERRGETGEREEGGKQNSLLGFSSGELCYYGLIVRGGEEYVKLSPGIDNIEQSKQRRDVMLDL